jgi:hypothetical protein
MSFSKAMQIQQHILQPNYYLKYDSLSQAIDYEDY